MKALVVLSLVFAVFVMSFYGQEVEKRPTITVTATADIMVQPDEVLFYLDVTKRDKNMQIAKSAADVALGAILDLTRRFGIQPENVKTDHISVEMKYKSIRDPKNRIYNDDGEEIGTRVFLGYDVSTTVVVRLTDLKRFEEFFGEVLKTGVSEISSVRFQSSEIVAQTKNARVLAMKGALEKATAMAGAINQTVGKAIFISEGAQGQGFRIDGASGTSNTFVVDGSSRTTLGSEQIATFSPGSMKISSQVTVTFLLN